MHKLCMSIYDSEYGDDVMKISFCIGFRENYSNNIVFIIITISIYKKRNIIKLKRTNIHINKEKTK